MTTQKKDDPTQETPYLRMGNKDKRWPEHKKENQVQVIERSLNAGAQNQALQAFGKREEGVWGPQVLVNRRNVVSAETV